MALIRVEKARQQMRLIGGDLAQSLGSADGQCCGIPVTVAGEAEDPGL
jgi:hypothetical protein